MGLLKACSATPIIVEMCFSILQSVDMKLARYLKSFTSSINSPVALVSASGEIAHLCLTAVFTCSHLFYCPSCITQNVENSFSYYVRLNSPANDIIIVILSNMLQITDVKLSLTDTARLVS